MKDKKYNGWANYETWCVKLWLDNEESSYNYWTETAQEVYNQAKASNSFTKEEQAILDLSEQLKNEIEEANPLPEAGMFTDLLNTAIGSVDWHEIASAYIEEVEKEEQETAEVQP